MWSLGCKVPYSIFHIQFFSFSKQQNKDITTGESHPENKAVQIKAQCIKTISCTRGNVSIHKMVSLVWLLLDINKFIKQL